MNRSDELIVVNLIEKKGHWGGIAIRRSGYLHEYTHVGTSIPREYKNGEWGDKLNKVECAKMAEWCMLKAAREAPDELWSVY